MAAALRPSYVRVPCEASGYEARVSGRQREEMNDDLTTIQMRASRVLRPLSLVCGAALLMMSAWMHQACGTEAVDIDDRELS